MKLPHLYAKLANLIDSEANTRGVVRRQEIIQKTTATYRVSKDDLKEALRELEAMHAIRQVSQRRIATNRR